MNKILNESRFAFVAKDDKAFILAFNHEMNKLGYDFGEKIGSGYCWGKYMIIYTKSRVKSKRVYARVYMRPASIALRLFFSDIDKHRAYIEHAPAHVKQVFAGDHGKCKHCHNEKRGKCMFRKTYTLDDRLIEKCGGVTFEFHNPRVGKIEDYVSLFTEFYPRRKS